VFYHLYRLFYNNILRGKGIIFFFNKQIFLFILFTYKNLYKYLLNGQKEYENGKKNAEKKTKLPDFYIG
jgi:hypothetical protein